MPPASIPRKGSSGPFSFQTRLLSSSSTPKTNVGVSYDAYYQGEESIYKRLYGDNIISRDKTVIRETALQSTSHLKEGETLRLLDYGCGDGRYMQAILPIAEILKERKIHVELIAYDPSRAGLEIFEGKLLKTGFTQTSGSGYHDIASEHGGNSGYTANVLINEKQNLTVKFVHGHVNDQLGYIEQLIGRADATMCMYGVLSHIESRQKRIDVLEMIGNITPNGNIVVTLPGRRMFPKEQKAYNFLREKNYPADDLKDAQQKGDLYYVRNQGKTPIKIFYHIYQTMQEVIEDFAAAKLKCDVQVQKILHETTLTANPQLDKLDEQISATVSYWIKNPKIIDNLAGYYLALAKPMEYTVRKSQSVIHDSNRVAHNGFVQKITAESAASTELKK